MKTVKNHAKVERGAGEVENGAWQMLAGQLLTHIYPSHANYELVGSAEWKGSQPTTSYR